jgi:hypothetical protein
LALLFISISQTQWHAPLSLKNNRWRSHDIHHLPATGNKRNCQGLTGYSQELSCADV